MASPDNPIEEIKQKLDIVEVIGSYIKLKKTGANYGALCPFHSEKKPSFFVSPARQLWKCFGCGEGGSIFDFVMKIEGVEFGDALRILAKRAGVELKAQDPQLKTKRKRLYEICELSCQFFQKQLKESKIGKEAYNYLLKRGIKKESIKKWRLGYSPDTWRGLSDFLVGKGYERDEIVKAGLAVESEKAQTPYDRFRGRIIFPVFDLHSQVIGFGGRVFKDSQKNEIAKYINIPQTLLYNKSRVLYGLDNAKVPIRKKDKCILAEGYTDVIMSHQAGFENTVATSGTALTSEHLSILKRYSENLLLAFDMDIAGDSATKRGIDLAQQRGFNIQVIQMPQGSDPADIIQESPEKWGKLIEDSKSIMEFYFDSAFSKCDKETPEGKKEIGKLLLPVIKRIPNKIEQSHWVQKLARDLGVKEDDVFEELKKAKLPDSYPSGSEPAPQGHNTYQQQKEKRKKDREEVLKERVLALLIRNPGCLELLEKEHFSLFSDSYQKVLRKLQKCVSGKEQKNFNEIITELQKDGSEELKELLNTFSFMTETEEEDSLEAGEEIKTCLSELKSIEIKNKLKEISEDIKKAEEQNNDSEASSLIKKFNELSQQLRET